MAQIDQASYAAVQPQLTPGESVQWAGQPNRSIIFHKQDAFLIPFSLLWGGFALFWEASVAGLTGFGDGRSSQGPWKLGMAWGAAFVLAGQYFIWGRFVYDAWLKRRTFYAVTNRRVLVVQQGWNQKTASAFLDSLPAINKDDTKNGIGTLTFGVDLTTVGRRGTQQMGVMTVGAVPTFVDIDDVDSVYRLVSDLREKARGTGSS